MSYPDALEYSAAERRGNAMAAAKKDAKKAPTKKAPRKAPAKGATKEAAKKKFTDYPGPFPHP